MLELLLANAADFYEALLESHDVVALLDVGDSLSNALNNAGSFVSENDREGSFWIAA